MAERLLHDGMAYLKLAKPLSDAEFKEGLDRIHALIVELYEAHFSGEEQSRPGMMVIASEDPQELKAVDKVLRLLDKKKKDFEKIKMEQLIELAMPLIDLPCPDEFFDQAKRNSEYRAHFLKNFAALEAKNIHGLRGSAATNKSQLVGGWRTSGKIFCVQYEKRKLYPVFQFDLSGNPKPVIGRILKALGPNMGPWQTAIWFTSANAYLKRKRPIDVLDTDPDSVVTAAEQFLADNLF